MGLECEQFEDIKQMQNVRDKARAWRRKFIRYKEAEYIYGIQHAEFQELLAQKRKLYEEYHKAKENMQVYKIAKYDIDRILGYETELDLSQSSRRERDQTR